MEPMEHNKPFEQLRIPRKDLQLTITRYRVYSDAREFVTVEARTALEAIEASGIKNAYKIMKDDPLGGNLLSSKDWSEQPSNMEEANSNEPIASTEVAGEVSGS